MGVENEEGNGEFRIQLHFQSQRELEKRSIFSLSLSSLLLSLVICGAIQRYEDHKTLDE